MSKEYCRHCGKQNNGMPVFALPGLCYDCGRNGLTDDLYDTATGEAIPCVPAQPEQRHDGNLDADQQSYWHANVSYYPYRAEPRIDISGGYEFEGTLLDPKQALSLRDWLIQESPTLERMAKEQGE